MTTINENLYNEYKFKEIYKLTIEELKTLSDHGIIREENIHKNINYRIEVNKILDKKIFFNDDLEDLKNGNLSMFSSFHFSLIDNEDILMLELNGLPIASIFKDPEGSDLEEHLYIDGFYTDDIGGTCLNNLKRGGV